MDARKFEILKNNLEGLAESLDICQVTLGNSPEALDEIQRELYQMRTGIEYCLKCFEEKK